MKKSSENNGTDLRFLESSDEYGFTSTNIMNFRERSPAAIVRELIQNSLDAAQSGEKAIVRFISSRVNTEDIPGIDSYRNAFDKAIHYRMKDSDGKLSDQESMVVSTIKKSLDCQEQDVLAVVDNGCGLNTKTMRALLSDGVSSKAGNTATGAFGNGHFTVFPTSDLRYVLYGAVHGNKENGSREWLASGHAILASHFKNEKDKIGRSANGYYIASSDGRKHIYPKKREISPFIMEFLNEIDRDYNSGTVVVVPAFNHFGQQKKDLDAAIRKASACNFFVAIHREELEIDTDDRVDGISSSIDKRNLEHILFEFIDEKRGGKDKDYLVGNKANSAYQCLKNGQSYSKEVLGGTIEIIIHKREGKPRVHLCRNGMWITSNNQPTGGIPGFYAAFEEHEPFEALLLVNASTSGRFHELVRNSEGPMHNFLDISQLPDVEKKELRDAFRTIKKWIKEKIPKISHDEYIPDDFLNFVDGSSNLAGGKNSPLGYKGKLLPAPRMSRRRGASTGGSQIPIRENDSTGSSGPKTIKSNKNPAPSIRNGFRVISVPQGTGQVRMSVKATTAGKNLWLYLMLDENEDISTDNIWQDRGAIITEASIDGRIVPQHSIVDDGEVSCLELGDMEKDTSINIELKYRVEIDGKQVSDPAFRIVIKQQPPLEQDRGVK